MPIDPLPIDPLLIDQDNPDDFEMLPRGAGAANVLDENPRFLRLRGFRSRHLAGRRDVLVYLPETYENEPDRRFPVLYLNDGQNLFDGRTSYIADRTWRADTTADRMVRGGKTEPTILVGIDNMGLRRMAEYTPTRDARLGGGAGPKYGRLLVEELKPRIDSRFRTLAGPEHTGLGGSSLGGLISLALGLEYRHVFGRLAVMSPSVWWDQRSILNAVSEFRLGAMGRSDAARPKIWMDMGTAEGLRHLRDTDLLHRRLQLRGWKDGTDLYYLRVAGALHDETAWAERFDRVLEFLFPKTVASG